MPDDVMLTTTELAALVGVSPRRLHHWAHNGYLPAAYAQPGSGVRRLWSPPEVQTAQAFAVLRELGVPLHVIAAALPTLAVGPHRFAIELDGTVVTGPLS
jgi:DNA-binding transcriptional MerR regulator